jgi:hypothetical protein
MLVFFEPDSTPTAVEPPEGADSGLDCWVSRCFTDRLPPGWEARFFARKRLDLWRNPKLWNSVEYSERPRSSDNVGIRYFPACIGLREPQDKSEECFDHCQKRHCQAATCTRARQRCGVRSRTPCRWSTDSIKQLRRLWWWIRHGRFLRGIDNQHRGKKKATSGASRQKTDTLGPARARRLPVWFAFPR